MLPDHDEAKQHQKLALNVQEQGQVESLSASGGHYAPVGLAQEFTAAFEMTDSAEKWAKLMKLSADFEDQIKAYARIIVMELYTKDIERKIPVVNMGKHV